MIENNGQIGLGNWEPWRDLESIHLLLTFLVNEKFGCALNCSQIYSEPSVLAEWFMQQEIGPLAYYRFNTAWPELGRYLQEDAYAAVAEHSIQYDSIRRMNQAFTEAGIPLVLLKGAALALAYYPDPALRTMSDVDVWVKPDHMVRAFKVMKNLGYRALGHPQRPPQLQVLYQGEIQFYDDQNRLVELHWAPVSGWQIRKTTVIDDESIWDRKKALNGHLAGIYVLSNEDTIIQLALHTAINHRFRLNAIRSFVDIALLARTTAVSWSDVAERAINWRVATAVYCVFSLAHSLIDIPGIEEALNRLRPSPLRRFLLERFVSAKLILNGDEKLGDPMQNNRRGYLFLLLLIDRPIDVIKLLWQAIWPSRDWLDARYGEGRQRWRHIIQVVSKGRF